MFDAALQRMAVVAAARTGDGLKPFGTGSIFLVVDQAPCAVEGGRPQVVRVRGDDVARRVADGAIDALGRLVGADTDFACGVDARDRVVTGLRRVKDAFGLDPLVEERRHVHGEILDDGKVAERRDLKAPVLGDLVDVGAARPARAPVHGHRAGAAHPHPAGEAVGKRGLGVLLDPGDDIEHRLAVTPRHFVGDEVAVVAAAAPDLHRHDVRRLAHIPLPETQAQHSRYFC